MVSGDAGITAMGALALSLGIAIQNFPKGAIISMPLRAEGVGKGKAFFYGTLSGAVEPVGAALTILAAGFSAAVHFLLDIYVCAYEMHGRKVLKNLYGREYEEYCKKVNRCIPWLPRSGR